MGKYEEVKKLNDKVFRRLTGVKIQTFEKMVEILRKAHKEKKRKGGRPNKLSIEDMLLMTLEYLREYRTYLHIGKSYGISESNAYQNIKWVEDTLIKSGEFSLPGKKSLVKSDMEYELVLIDATETPIERPKRGSEIGIRERKRDIR